MLPDGTVVLQLPNQHTDGIVPLPSYHINKRLVGRNSKQTVNTLVGQHSALSENSVNLILQGMLESPFGRVLFGFIQIRRV